MKRLEPNLLVALCTGTSLLLLIMTASMFGEVGQETKYAVSAVLCSGAFVALNGWMARVTKRPEPQPLVRADAPTAILWAGLFPTLLILAALIPVVFTGHDYGLLVIIGAIWFGVTVDSAIRAARTGRA